MNFRRRSTVFNLAMVFSSTTTTLGSAQLLPPSYCTDSDSTQSGVIETIGGDPTCLLQECQGDCDSDNDCDGNLFCFQREDDDTPVPGCSGEPNGLYDYCYSCGSNSGVLENIEGNPVCPVQECAGNCDSDDDCDGNLFCFQGEDDDTPVPGCTGEPNGEYHYCYSCGSNSGVLENIGVNPACPLQECAGDCDSDDDCDGKLLCFQRDSTNPVVPGCIGTPHREWDYCINVLEALLIMSARINSLEDEHVNYRTRITELEEVVFHPSTLPSSTPSNVPSRTPSSAPSFLPSALPSSVPFNTPSSRPSTIPSTQKSPSTSQAPTSLCGSNSGILQDIGLNYDCLLQECAAHCRSDSNCAGELICYFRDRDDRIVPGCTGSPYGNWNYCINPSSSTTPSMQQSPSTSQAPTYLCGSNSGILEAIGLSHDCLLQECAGHCGSNSNCAGDLICYFRDRDNEMVPGCTGSVYGNWNYCIKP